MLEPLVRSERAFSRILLIVVIALLLAAFFLGRHAHAQTGGTVPVVQASSVTPTNLDVLSWSLPVTCSDGSTPTTEPGLKATRVELALSAAGPWMTLADVPFPSTQYWRRDVPPGTAYYAVRAVMTSGSISPQTLARAPTVTLAPVPLVVVAPEVYNTGSFDPSVSWLVKINKLYGTVALGTVCDENKPAKDGFYRVPTSAVVWTNPRAKTSYPLAKCRPKT